MSAEDAFCTAPSPLPPTLHRLFMLNVNVRVLACVCLCPQAPLYKPLTRLVGRRPALDLTAPPLFGRVLAAGQPGQRQEAVWALQLLRWSVLVRGGGERRGSPHQRVTQRLQPMLSSLGVLVCATCAHSGEPADPYPALLPPPSITTTSRAPWTLPCAGASLWRRWSWRWLARGRRPWTEPEEAEAVAGLRPRTAGCRGPRRRLPRRRCRCAWWRLWRSSRPWVDTWSCTEVGCAAVCVGSCAAELPLQWA